jgi:hypothetical protein
MTNGRVLWRAALALLLVLAGTEGCAKTLVFSTATKVGLDISQQADQTIDVTFGYDRMELASIPAPRDTDAGEGVDTYSVLGIFSISYGNPFATPREPLKVDQFFATGKAALKAAGTPGLKELFGRRTREILDKKDDAAPPARGGRP